MHRLKEHSKKAHGTPFKQEDKIAAVKSEPKKVETPKKKHPTVQQTQTANPKVEQPVSEMREISVNNSPTMLPTILTSLPTNMPLLVQAANGQVYLLANPNIQNSQLGGGIFLPSTSSVEFLPSNQTLFYSSQQQQQQQPSYLSPNPTGGNYFSMQATSSQIESESLFNSSISAAAFASSGPNQVLSTRHQIQQDKHQRTKQSLPSMQHQTHSTVNSTGSLSTSTSKVSFQQQKRDRLVSEVVSQPFNDVAPGRKDGFENGIKKVDNASTGIDRCQITSLIRVCRNEGLSRPQPQAASKKASTSYGRCCSDDIVRAALMENNIS
jgi:hypothetical protein